MSDFDKLKDWAKEKLGPLVKDVSMTTKLSNQPAMVTVWNLGTVRNYIKMIKMQNPDQTGHFQDDQLALMAEPTLQLSTNHAGNKPNYDPTFIILVTKKLMNLAESDPELAELVLLQVTSHFTFEVSSFSLFEKKINKTEVKEKFSALSLVNGEGWFE